MNADERQKAANNRHANATNRATGDPDAPIWCAAHEIEFPNLIAALEQGAMTHQARKGRAGVTMGQALQQLAPFDNQNRAVALDFSALEIAFAWSEIGD